MHKKFIFALIVVVLATQLTAPTVFAVEEPKGSCPPGFSLERAMEHDMHHHQHVGTHDDLNGDGYICMKPVTPTGNIHVHVDNKRP